ncbi:MAG TPA: hypothetical protein VG676_13375 [Chitinophagaceae bacterium]|jgi:hypothetical protein|nr:hypothetical protein [Chitinophagaceae bacterium]
MKKLFIVTLVLGLVSLSASAQRAPQDRLLRFRTEQNFRKGTEVPQHRLRMQKNRLRYRMEQQRFRRDRIARSHMRGNALMKNRMNRQRMLFKRQHFFKGRRVI